MARQSKPRDDLERYIATLEKYVAALGFQLELKAVSRKKPSSKATRPRRAKK